MKKKTNLMRLIVSVCMFMVIICVMIWQNTQLQYIQHMQTESGVLTEVELLEEWQEYTNDTIKTIQKSVKVKNDSDVPVFVRASFEEVLQYLPQNASEISKDAPANHEAMGEYLPVIQQVTSQTFPLAGYVDITDVVGGLPVDQTKGLVNVWLKEGAEHGDNYRINDVLFAYRYAAEDNELVQKMTGTLYVQDPSLDWDDRRYEARQLLFSYYEHGYRYAVKNWAKSELVSPYSTDTQPTGFTYLGQQGMSRMTQFDYSLTDSGLGDAFQLPQKISTFPDAVGLYPSASVKVVNSFVTAAHQQLGAANIQIHFGAVSDFREIQRDSWVYNPEDGWFYYSVPIDASYMSDNHDATTYSLVDKIECHLPLIDNVHTTYHFLPKVEVIQTSDIGALVEVFGLTEGSSETASNRIYHYLRALQQ